MIRRPFYATSVISLLLCIAAAVLWVKSDAPEVYAVTRQWVAPDQLQSGSWNATAVLGDLTIWRLRRQWADPRQYNRGTRRDGGAGWRFEA